MKEFWNQRYSEPGFVYGTEPNAFFKEELNKLEPGNILLPGEGEGRNAVYAAVNQWNVFAFDQSEIAKTKAEKLADKKKVRINYQVQTFDNFTYDHKFECITLTFIHLAPAFRYHFHQKLIDHLKPGGTFVMECFSKNQLTYNTGGPKDADLLYCLDDLQKNFESLHIMNLKEHEIFLNEGAYHQGLASVIRLVAERQLI